MKNILVIGGSGEGLGWSFANRCFEDDDHRIFTLQRRAPSNVYWMWREFDLEWKGKKIEQHLDDLQDHYGAMEWVFLSGGAASMYAVPSDEQIEREVRTNGIGTFYVLRALLTWRMRHKKARETQLRALYAGSYSAYNRCPGIEVYASAKAMGAKYTIEWAKRYGRRYNLRGNVLDLGYFKSPMTDSIVPEVKEKMERANSLHRMAELDEVSSVAYTVLSGPDFWNGDAIQFTGGL